MASVRELAEAVVTSATPPAGFVRRPLELGTGEAEVYTGLTDPDRGRQVTVVVVVAPGRRGPSRAQLRGRFGLTPRESEVALLLADRRSNKEIAQELEISQKTAWRHTEHVLSKLSVGTRRDVGPLLATTGRGSAN